MSEKSEFQAKQSQHAQDMRAERKLVDSFGVTRSDARKALKSFAEDVKRANAVNQVNIQAKANPAPPLFTFSNPIKLEPLPLPTVPASGAGVAGPVGGNGGTAGNLGTEPADSTSAVLLAPGSNTNAYRLVALDDEMLQVVFDAGTNRIYVGLSDPDPDTGKQLLVWDTSAWTWTPIQETPVTICDRSILPAVDKDISIVAFIP